MIKYFCKTFSLLLTASLWLAQPITSQNITNVQVVNISCSSVVLSATINPVVSAIDFTWELYVNNRSYGQIVGIGLEGTGNITIFDTLTGYNHTIVNVPSFLPNGNDLFESFFTFQFEENADTNLVFQVTSIDVVPGISPPVNKPRCDMKYRGFSVSCNDMTQDCFLCGSDTPATITCPNNQQLTSFCSENARFNISRCPPQNPCTPNPCSNGGACIDDLRGRFTCSCPTIFTGRICETRININECDSNPCQNKGTCTDQVNNYNCSCVAGFTGTNCETNIDDCQPNPCLNGACVDAVNRYICICDRGFTGDNCEIDIDDCQTNPCLNGACTDAVNRYICTCDPGFTGENCAIRTCPSLDGLEFDAICTDSTNAGSRCVLQCAPGEILMGVTNIICLDTGRWNELLNATQCLSQNDVIMNLANSTIEDITELREATSEPNELFFESVSSVTRILDSYLNETNDGISASTLEEATETVSNLFSSESLISDQTEESVSVKSNLLEILNGFTERLVLNATNETISVRSTNVNLQARQISASDIEENGILFNVEDERNYSIVAVSISNDSLSRLIGSNNGSVLVFVTTLSEQLTLDESQDTSMIVTIGTNSRIQLELNATITFQNTTLPLPQETLPQNPLKRRLNQNSLVEWDFETEMWRTCTFCELVSRTPPRVESRRLGSFAFLFSFKVVPSIVALTIISYVGCGISILCLIATIVIYLGYKELRTKATRITLVNICACLIAVYLLFSAGIGSVNHKETCDAITFLLHFTILSCFTWMSINAFQLYKAITVLSMVTLHDNVLIYAIGYGIPLVLVLINFSVTVWYLDPLYNEDIATDSAFFESLYRANFICWLQPPSFYYGFLLPVGLLLTYNYGVFVVFSKKIIFSERKKKRIRSSAKEKLPIDHFLNSMTLVTVTGLTWIFGYFLLISEDVAYQSVMQWLFTIFNAFQGIVIFLLYCVRKTNVRNIWLHRKGDGKVLLSGSMPSHSTSKATNNTVPQENTETNI